MNPPTLACFVTPHGFGHATRACAVVAALHKRAPELHFKIFSSVPEHIFRASLDLPYTLHEVQTDVGMVQKNPLHADLDATVRALESFYPVPEPRLSQLAEQV